MIKAVAKGKRGTLVVLGLSRMNIDRLVAGEPIAFSGASIEQPQIASVMIFFGETEATMEADMADLIGPDTEVRR